MLKMTHVFIWPIASECAKVVYNSVPLQKEEGVEFTKYIISAVETTVHLDVVFFIIIMKSSYPQSFPNMTVS